ncbi:MAG: nitroreductase [Alphaproteobacteria bacterium]
MKVSEAVARRKSIRVFTDRPVDPADLAWVLDRALRAPSGGNLQPWHFYLLHGPAMDRFKARMDQRLQDPAPDPREYDVYPKGLQEPYRSRRFKVGEDMYALLGIAREDKPARLMWLANNFRFFGAPAGLFCFVDRAMGPPQWSDLGMVLQTMMLLFQERGIDTCAQEAWSTYAKTVSDFVQAPEDLMLFCGLAIGYRDEDAPVNTLVSDRAPLAEVLTELS